MKALAALSRVLPGLAGRIAARLFTRPRRHTPRPVELASARDAREERLPDGTRLLHFGAAGPRVLAIHGWEGRATQLAPLATRLVAAGLRVTVVDAPAHGATPGRVAHPVAFARALVRVARHLGDVEGLVGHSMGGGSILLALRDEGLAARPVVLIASPSSFATQLARFAAHVGLTPAGERAFLAAMARIVGRAGDTLDLTSFKVEAPVLIAHDRADLEVPFSAAEQLLGALPAARLVESGAGHRAILRDPIVLESVSRFFEETLRKDPSCPKPSSSMPSVRPAAGEKPERAA